MAFLYLHLYIVIIAIIVLIILGSIFKEKLKDAGTAIADWFKQVWDKLFHKKK